MVSPASEFPVLNGHTDTSFTGTPHDLRMAANLEPDDELRGRIVGDKVQGLGISNMKGGLASFMVAGKAMKVPSGSVAGGSAGDCFACTDCGSDLAGAKVKRDNPNAAIKPKANPKN